MRTHFVGSDRADHQEVEFLECYVLIRQWIKNKRSSIIHSYISTDIPVWKGCIDIVFTCIVSCLYSPSTMTISWQLLQNWMWYFKWHLILIVLQNSGNIVYVNVGCITPQSLWWFLNICIICSCGVFVFHLQIFPLRPAFGTFIFKSTHITNVYKIPKACPLFHPKFQILLTFFWSYQCSIVISHFLPPGIIHKQ
jgi:hypothetical protein